MPDRTVTIDDSEAQLIRELLEDHYMNLCAEDGESEEEVEAYAEEVKALTKKFT